VATTRPRRGSRVHRGLVGDRALIGRDYLADPALRAEYARDIAPRTEAALGKILAEVFTGVPAPQRALDLGAGTGAASAALRTRFGTALEIVAVDRVATAPGLIRADLAVELKQNGQPVPNTRLAIGASIGDHEVNYHNLYHNESEAVAEVNGDIKRHLGNYSFTYDANNQGVLSAPRPIMTPWQPVRRIIRCASAGGNVEIQSTVAHKEGAIAGTWKELVRDMSGEVTGTVTSSP